MEKMYTTKETMAALRVSRTTLHNLVKSGQITPVKLGKKTLFLESELTRFIEALKKDSAAK